MIEEMIINYRSHKRDHWDAFICAKQGIWFIEIFDARDMNLVWIDGILGNIDGWNWTSLRRKSDVTICLS